jgi:hypothetical protein
MLQGNNSPKYILNQIAGSADDVLFDPCCRDNCTEPYIKLRKKCMELGYVFEGTKTQRLEDCRWLIFWDCTSLRPMNRIKAKIRGYSPRHLYQEATKAGVQDKMVLFLFEPPAVCPENYHLTLHKDFSIIFTWDPTLIDGKKYFQILLPSPTDFPKPSDVPFSQKKLLTNISSYKFSSHPRELYSDIRTTIRFFEENYPDEFDLYGLFWNMNMKQRLMHWRTKFLQRNEYFPSYRGIAGNKWEIFPKYKFALCYENMSYPGNVSLKILDCLRSGCVPVYLGAPDITDYVDKEAFIDRRGFKTLEDMGKYLSCVNAKEYQKYVDAAKIYQESERFKLFLSENFVETIVRTLKLGK